jgi:competence protein ComEA
MGMSAPWRALETSADEPATAAPAGRTQPTLLLALAVVVLLVGSLAVVAYSQIQAHGQVQVVSGGNGSGAPAGSSSVAMVVVQVAGAVARPGVYSLPVGSRVGDAIKAAGGYSPDVDPRAAETALNLAAKLQDAQSIVVPRRGEAAAGSSGSAASKAPGPLNLNTASAAELDSLPGIGPTTAAKIVTSRQQLAFTSVDDLVSRKLVSATVLAKFRDQVTV